MPRETNNQNNTNIISILFGNTNLRSILLSAASVVISIFSFCETKKQADIALTAESPYLTTITKIDYHSNQYGFFIENTGKGVALIDSIKINNIIRDEGINNKQWDEIFSYLEYKENTVNIFANSNTAPNLRQLSHLKNCYMLYSPQKGMGVSSDSTLPILTLSPIVMSWLKDSNKADQAEYLTQDYKPIANSLHFGNMLESLNALTDINPLYTKHYFFSSDAGKELYSRTSPVLPNTPEYKRHSYTNQKPSLSSIRQEIIAECLNGIERIDKLLDIKIKYKSRIPNKDEAGTEALRISLFK